MPYASTLNTVSAATSAAIRPIGLMIHSQNFLIMHTPLTKFDLFHMMQQ
jgi:hypothetical protein